MNIKRLTAGMVMTLTLMMVASPIIKASASQDTNQETPKLETNNTISDMDYNKYSDYVKSEKEKFQTEYGTENKFNLVYEDEYEKEEVNGSTGETKITNKETGEVFVFNYFKDLDEELKISQMSKDDCRNYIKEKFQAEYGTEDKFVVYDGEYEKDEINGSTGEVRRTNKETGEVCTFNYIDEAMKQVDVSYMSEEEITNYIKTELKEQYGEENKLNNI